MVGPGDRVLPLPPSRKTRALLAYLVLTGRPHRRDRLCDLFWDVTDDPRGALRWSLSRLRGLVDEPPLRRIVADRNVVAFEPAGAEIDALEVQRRLARGTDDLPLDDLEVLAHAFRSEPLQDLDLPDFHDYQAWWVGQREHLRAVQGRVLEALLSRLPLEDLRGLEHARSWARDAPGREAAWAALVARLGAVGRVAEAEQQHAAARRALNGAPVGGALAAAWAGVQRRVGAAAAAPPGPPPPRPALPAGVPPAGRPPLVGRTDVLARLGQAMDQATGRRHLVALLLTGEPGAGKTRLLDELEMRAAAGRATVLRGTAYQAELGRPYGPWMDALGTLKPSSFSEGIGPDAAPLLARDGWGHAASGEGGAPTRERLFGAVSELLASRALGAPPVVLVFDDAQWLDPASAALLHYAIRMNRHRPVMLAMAARTGELVENGPVQEVVRLLRREGVLEELPVGPLEPAETEELVRQVAPGLDASRVHAQSAGNPLFALELARAGPRPGQAPPPTIADLVRDRLQRLPEQAREILHWAAILDGAFDLRRLMLLTGLELEELMPALALLERYSVLEPGPSGREDYGFAHDVVREAVLSGISAPRRRLMHRRVAERLAAAGGDDGVAAEVARHAMLAGDAALAGRACVRAARRCLRVFAGEEAASLARRGLECAAALQEPERTELTLELTAVAVEARRPGDIGTAADEVEALAQHALVLGAAEHARLGFHLASHLRWEGGDWSAAHRHSIQAEVVSRTSGTGAQMRALAEAGRCLTMLERDLPHAESLLMEAQALSGRDEPVAIPLARGMLRLHRGEVSEAVEYFERARLLARRDGDRLAEFHALEQAVVAELQRGRLDTAESLCTQLVGLGEKLRAGSESPCAHSLTALVRYLGGAEGAEAYLEEGIVRLTEACSKHRLAFVLTRAALAELERRQPERAARHARLALQAALDLKLPSEIVLARIALTRAALALGDRKSEAEQTRALRQEVGPMLSRQARDELDRLFGAALREARA